VWGHEIWLLDAWKVLSNELRDAGSVRKTGGSYLVLRGNAS
jgi:hypothetical protein